MATPDADVDKLGIRHRFPVSLHKHLCRRQDYQLGQVVLSPWHCDLELASLLVLLCDHYLSIESSRACPSITPFARADLLGLGVEEM